MWSEALKLQGVQSYAPNSGRLILGFGRLLSFGKDKAVVFRYLNDRKSFFHSLFFLLSDVLTCALSWLLGVKRIWILHNVDHESSANYKSMVQLRRILVSNCVSRILVTDPLLIESAKAVMPKHANKIDYVTFGEYKLGLIKKNHTQVEESIDHHSKNYLLSDFDEVLQLLANQRDEYDHIGFCGGKYSKKRTNFHKIPNLIEASKENDLRLLLVVISNMKRSDNEHLYDFMKKSPDVMFFNSLIDLDEFRLSPLIDFYWSGYSDISIPYTLYTAATVAKPIISIDTGILPLMVKEYQLGLVLENDFRNIKECLIYTEDKTTFEFDKFLQTHSWQTAGSQIIQAAFPSSNVN